MSDIWNDPAVRNIYTSGEHGQPQLLLGDLFDDDRKLVLRYLKADGKAVAGATAAIFADACAAAIAAVDRLSPINYVGWKHFILHVTGYNVVQLWAVHQDPKAVATARWM